MDSVKSRVSNFVGSIKQRIASLRPTPSPLTWKEIWRSEHPLFYFGTNERDPFTVDDSFKHVFVTGASGSGKTSGSLATVFRAYLSAGYGGLVLCAKPSERALWTEQYCRQTGRVDDVIVVTPGGEHRFNFLDHELRRQSRGSKSVTNIVELFVTIQSIIENDTKESLGEDFWDRSTKDLITYTVVILSLCEAPLTLANIKRFITSAPHKGQKDDPHWQSISFAAQRMAEAYRAPKTPREADDLEAALDYFTHDFLELGDRTRSSIEITFSSIASRFLIGDTRELLCTHTTITPEMLWEEGKIIILDLPISEFSKEGLLIQGVIKYSFQKAMLRRNLQQSERPVFIAMDEYQNFMSAYDYLFLSEARSYGVSVVMATQNISNLYSILGSSARDQANSLLGNAATKIFHANTDVTTNEYASQVIGQQWMQMMSTSTKRDGQLSGSTVSKQIHALKLPSDFMRLKTGGRQNNFQVEGVVVQTGHGIWHSTKSVYHTARFMQDFGSR